MAARWAAAVLCCLCWVAALRPGACLQNDNSGGSPERDFEASALRRGRRLLQGKLAGGAFPLGMEGDWEVYSASHFSAFEEVAGFAADSSRSVHVRLTNHIVADGKDLPFSIAGKLWISGACDEIPLWNSPNHVTMEQFNQSVVPMCQFFLNSMRPTADTFSFLASQDRIGMPGQSFLRVENGGEIKLEDLEFAGCYSLQGGGCIRMEGGHLHAERVAFSASTSEGPGGAIWASVTDSGEFKSTVNLTYPAFWESKSKSTSREVFFKGGLGDIVLVPATLDKSVLEIVNTGASPPSPPPTPAAPPPPPPSPPPPPPASPSPPPPPMPGYYVPYSDGLDGGGDEMGSGVSGDVGNRAIVVAASIGFLALAMLVCYSGYLVYRWRTQARARHEDGQSEADDGMSECESPLGLDADVKDTVVTVVVPFNPDTAPKDQGKASNAKWGAPFNHSVEAVVKASLDAGPLLSDPGDRMAVKAKEEEEEEESQICQETLEDKPPSPRPENIPAPVLAWGSRVDRQPKS